jgi:WD40 repeat protein/tRNA A-37 threonylcarbamoyl transferase component Bud32
MEKGVRPGFGYDTPDADRFTRFEPSRSEPMSPTACPSLDELQAFSVGDLPEALLAELATHLENCKSCEVAAQSLDRLTDPVMAAYRRSALSGAAPTAMPTRIGEYEVLAEIGRGGMGVVYKARHRRLGRVVALKMLLRGPFAGPEEKARFKTEAEAVARLQHANIVQLFEAGEYDGGDGQPRPYFTLEFVDGQSLSARMAGRPQPPALAAVWIQNLARAVQFAHDHGVVHRDLKPSNILLTGDGHPKLCDFGVAKLLTGSDLKTLSGAVLGTIEYMAPEQAAGEATVGPAADIYALGAILYCALTGRPPFQGTSALVTLEQVRQREPVPPRLLVPAVPRDLNTICLKCLEKKPASRYASAAALADDLRRFLAGEPIVARPVTAYERAWKWAKRRPALAGLLALSLIVLFIGFPGAMALWLQADRARAAADGARDQLEGAVYAGRIALADHAYQDTEVPVALNLLAACAPEAGRADRRHWEWRYLNRLCHSDLIPGLGHTGRDAGWVFGLAFHPDGKTLVSAAGLPGGALAGRPLNAGQITPGETRVWDLETGRCLTTLTGHAGALRAAAFSPDGRWLATSSADGHVRLWDGHNFADRGLIAATDGNAKYLTFTPDGRSLIIGFSAAVVVWDVEERKQRFAFSGKSLGGPALAVDPAGRLAFGDFIRDGRPKIEFRDLRSGEELPHEIPGAPLNAMTFSRDGRYLALALQGDHRIQIWDGAGAKLLRQLVGHTNEVNVIVFCPDGRLASASDDRTVRVWDPATGAELTQYRGHGVGVLSLSVSPDGRRLASGDKAGDVKVWDLTRDPRGVVIRPSPVGEYLDDFTFSDDGRQLVTISDRDDDKDVHSIAHWDALTGQLQDRHTLRPVKPDESRHRIYAFSGDSKRFAGPDWADLRIVTMFDASNGDRVTSFHTSEVPVNGVSLDLRARRIAFGGWKAVPAGAGGRREVHAELVVADANTGREILRPRLPAGHIITPIALSPDGRRLACAVRAVSFDGETMNRAPTASVYMWSLTDGGASGKPLVLDGSFDGSVTCLTFGPDDRRIAAGGADSTVRIWDADTGHAVFAPVQASHPATGLAFSPDGRRLAAAGIDGLVHLWDAGRGDRLLTLHGLGPRGSGHYGFTARVVFSPDGLRLASNDWDGTVTTWDASAPDQGNGSP